MRDLAKALLVCAAVFTSVSFSPKQEVPAYFIPPPVIMADVIEGRWLPFSLTGNFHVDFRYAISEEEEIIAHYQAVDKVGDGFKLTQSKPDDYEIRAKSTK